MSTEGTCSRRHSVRSLVENVKLIQAAIRDTCKDRKELNLVFLNLATAFDTVQHESLILSFYLKWNQNNLLNSIVEP